MRLFEAEIIDHNEKCIKQLRQPRKAATKDIAGMYFLIDLVVFPFRFRLCLTWFTMATKELLLHVSRLRRFKFRVDDNRVCGTAHKNLWRDLWNFATCVCENANNSDVG